MCERTPGETFAHLITLHLDNDEGLYNARREIVAEARRSADGSDIAGTNTAEWQHLAERAAVADALRDFTAEMIHEALGADNQPCESLLALDVIGAALGYVDWLEMAQDYMDEADDEGFDA